MGLNDTPMAERIQIGFFGCTNAGKSSVVNAITGQNMAIVSDEKGTTTDPVIKAMELLPLGPVAIIDTPGLDDDTRIGELRINKTKEIINRIDIAVIVLDINSSGSDKKVITDLLNECRKRELPVVIVFNKTDMIQNVKDMKEDLIAKYGFSEDKENITFVSALTKEGINELKELIARIGIAGKEEETKRYLISDIINKGDTVILVMPIDESAPKGRIILPQQQLIRDILDAQANALCVQPGQLKELFESDQFWKYPESGKCPESGKDLESGKGPALVVTDSQVFKEVESIVPKHTPLTSFSIVLARYKGTLEGQVAGARAIEELEDGDTVLVAEGCTHHRQCEDIGTVKLPRLLRKYTGKDIKIETSSGHGYPEDLSKYKMIFHCGGCVLSAREVKSRIRYAENEHIPITNYGISIAYMNGIVERSIEPFNGKL